MQLDPGRQLYSSGQGILWGGAWDGDTPPKGMMSLGNASEISVSVASEQYTEKGSRGGVLYARRIYTTETSASLSMTLESFTSRNVALMVAGTATDLATSTFDYDATGGFGSTVMLPGLYCGSVVVTYSGTELTAYSSTTAPYDYRLDYESGAIQFNDGRHLPLDMLDDQGVTVTSVTGVGYEMVVYCTVPSSAEVGNRAAVFGLDESAADSGGYLDGAALEILEIGSGYVVLKTYYDSTDVAMGSGTTRILFDGFTVNISGTCAARGEIAAMTTGTTTYSFLFTGINSLDGLPFTVYVPKAVLAPSGAVSLVTTEIANTQLSANVIADHTNNPDSPFFTVRVFHPTKFATLNLPITGSNLPEEAFDIAGMLGGLGAFSQWLQALNIIINDTEYGS